MQIEFENYKPLISGGKVFDPIRKKWLEALPEELVRQHLIQYLLIEKNYPIALMRLEHPHRVNELYKRSDIVVYNRNGHPAMLIECKEPTVRLNEDVLMQALLYNMHLGATYLMLCNGIQCICFENSTAIDFVPSFDQLK